MDCHEESYSLCPSRRLEIPALPLHGKSFRNGVRFSVQTTSCGKLPWSKCNPPDEEWLPSGENERTGRMVLVKSIKLMEAQKSPDKAFVNVSHL